MKLQELTEAQAERHLLGNIPLIKRTSTDGVVDFTKLKHIGAGVEGDVYAAKHHGVVVKVVRLQHGISESKIGKNAYLRFVSACLNNKSNPFFPKIISAKVYQIPAKLERHIEGNPLADEEREWRSTDYSDFVLIIAMERLVELDDIPIDLAEKIYNRVGLTLSIPGGDKDSKSKTKQGLTTINALGLTRRSLNNIKNNTTNRNLQQALDVLAPLFAKFGGDTHSGNFMFRKTGGGMQLVFIDPLDPTGWTAE